MSLADSHRRANCASRESCFSPSVGRSNFQRLACSTHPFFWRPAFRSVRPSPQPPLALARALCFGRTQRRARDRNCARSLQSRWRKCTRDRFASAANRHSFGPAVPPFAPSVPPPPQWTYLVVRRKCDCQSDRAAALCRLPGLPAEPADAQLRGQPTGLQQ